MLLQQIILGIIVVGALSYLGKQVFASFRSEKGCAGACKCDPVKETIK